MQRSRRSERELKINGSLQWRGRYSKLRKRLLLMHQIAGRFGWWFRLLDGEHSADFEFGWLREDSSPLGLIKNKHSMSVSLFTSKEMVWSSCWWDESVLVTYIGYGFSEETRHTRLLFQLWDTWNLVLQ